MQALQLVSRTLGEVFLESSHHQWWRLEEPGDTPVVAGLGYGGQYLLIIPERDLVAVMTGWNIFEPYPSALTPFLQALLSSTAR